MDEQTKTNGWIGTRHGIPKVGDVAERSIEITARHIDLFTGMSSDRYPYGDR